MTPGKAGSVRTLPAAALAVALMIGACMEIKVQTADKLEGSPKAPPGADIARPAEASSAMKAADFRLNPPAVEGVQLKRTGQKGSSLLMVKIGPDARVRDTLTLRPDGATIVLSDAGKEGDEKAGDRIFTATVPLDFDEEVKRQDATLAALKQRNKPLLIREFRGREIVRRREVDLRQLMDLRRNGVLDLIDVGGAVVDEKKSLLVTDTSVVEDTTRTFNPCTNAGTPGGKWTFGYLMTQMANEPVTGINPSDFTQRLFRHWLFNQTVNTFTVGARAPGMQAMLNSWPKLGDGRLDLTRAPLKLLAIVNRVDLATNAAYGPGNAGEGRFVFGVVNTAAGCAPTRFLVILEYGVPRHTCSEIKSWAQQWLDLDALSLNSAAYRAGLEAITETFARANAAPSRPNASAINQVRTNELGLGVSPWELREFQIFSTDSDAGQLRMVTVKQTPDRDTYNSPAPQEAQLATWINNNAAAIEADRHTVPADLPFPSLLPFLGGASKNNIDFWNAPLIASANARFHFSLNTCNGCHGRETNTAFVHIDVAPFGSEAQLSGFLKGDGAGGDFAVGDPVVLGTQHLFNDLARRAQVLHDLASRSCLLRPGHRPILMTH